MKHTPGRGAEQVSGRSTQPALRVALITAELARRAGEAVPLGDLLAVPKLRALYATEESAALQALRRDLRKLTGGALRRKAAASAELISYDLETSTASLVVDVPRLQLSMEALEALMMLASACRGGQALPDGVELFSALLSALPDVQRNLLASALNGGAADLGRLKLELALPALEAEQMATLRALRQALRWRRVVSFRYRPLGSAGETLHAADEVEEVRADASHIYVTVWCDEAQAWLDLRLDRVVPGSVDMSPRQVVRRRRRGVEVRYWLAANIARHGVTERLEDQRVEPGPGDGVIVSGRARNRFWARRLLLGYGEHAKALHPPELVAAMRESVERMRTLYEEENDGVRGKG